MPSGSRRLLALVGLVAAGVVLVVVAWMGTIEQLVVVATLLVLGAAAGLGWLMVRIDRRLLAAIRQARPVVRQDVRRIEVVQPEAHLEQLIRTLNANTARLEEGQADLRARLDRLIDEP